MRSVLAWTIRVLAIIYNGGMAYGIFRVWPRVRENLAVTHGLPSALGARVGASVAMAIVVLGPLLNTIAMFWRPRRTPR